ncbi:MAG: P-II family nitrogen regulator [Bacilli bacterium]|nr:P-II family nitrogen regulator [Bacilli bacterium]
MAEKKEKFEVIIVFVNSGFADVVMNAAREEGARGGTIIHARGTGTGDMEKKYNIIITPDKEMIMILVNNTIKDKVLQAIYKAAGLATDGQGIAFTLPVNDVVGLKFD